jgi:hypothetical protein
MMKTFSELKTYCEKQGLQFEVNQRFMDNYTFLPAEERHEFGTFFGICNLANRKGDSEWSWTWFMSYDNKSELKEDSVFFFEERYSQLSGRSYKGWRERSRANEKIEKTLTA